MTGCATNSSEQQNQKVLDYQKSDYDYKMLVNKIKLGKAQASDFDNIIRIYPLTSNYQPKSSDEQAAKLMSQSQMQNGQWQACLATNNKVLASNFTSLTAHYGAAVCAAELDNAGLAKFHNAVLDSYIEAIWRTGNGQSAQSPFYITSANDLYAFVQLHQFVAVGQSLIYVNKLPVQVIEIQNPQTLRRSKWYFDVTPQFRRGMIDKLENK